MLDSSIDFLCSLLIKHIELRSIAIQIAPLLKKINQRSTLTTRKENALRNTKGTPVRIRFESEPERWP
jgi:hypothetical protein